MKKLIIMLSLITIFMTGCVAAKPKTTSLQRSQMRTKTIEASYDIAFRSLMITLENQGYTVDNTDYQTGLIKATAERDAVSSTERWLLGKSGVITYNVSATITKISKENTRVRINIREKSDISTSSQYGSNNSKSAHEIDDPTIYKSLFNDLRTETARMNAMR